MIATLFLLLISLNIHVENVVDGLTINIINETGMKPALSFARSKRRTRTSSRLTISNRASTTSGRSLAEGEFREALRLNPDYLLAHYSLANTLTRKGNWRGAAEHFKEAIALDQETVRDYVLGKLDPEKAKPVLEDIARAPSDALAHFYVASTIRAARLDCHKGIEELNEAIRMAPQFLSAKYALQIVEKDCN